MHWLLNFHEVTEAAALAAHMWLGRGDKNAADDAAVKAMRYMLNLIHMDAEIVIGEGEIDEAPMLYIGEKSVLAWENWFLSPLILLMAHV